MSRATVVGLGFVTAVAFVLRAVGMDQSLYGDEDFTYYIVTENGLGGVWRAVYDTSITPPLHYFLAWLSLQFGGDDTILVRLSSLLFGTVLVPLVFLIARTIAGTRAAFLAAILIALSPFAIWYSDEARAYATMMTLVALSSLALLKAIDGRGRAWWIVYALSACAALWTHYSAVFVVIAAGVWALWTHRERLRELMLVYAAIAVGYLPWLPGFLNQRQNDVGVEIINQFGPLRAGTVFELPLRTLVGHPISGLDEIPGAVGLVAAVLIVTLIAAAAAGPRRAVGRAAARLLRSDRGLPVVLALATPVGLLLYAAVASSLFLPRNLAASLPALAVTVGLVLARLTELTPRALAIPAVVAIVAVLGLGTVGGLGDEQRRPPYREAARHLDRTAPSNDPVVQQPLALVTIQRLPPTTLGRYFERVHPLYPAGPDAAPAWRRLRAGRSVHVVTPRALLADELAERQLRGDERAPAGLLERLLRLGGPDGRALLRARMAFPGVIPIELLRYAGQVDGRLERRGDQEVISWSLGQRVTVSPGVARGSVESIAPPGKPLTISGWAVDAARPRLVDWVLFFSRGRLFAVTAGGGRRPDIAAAQGAPALLSGFAVAPAPSPASRSTIRAFAIVGDRASELALGAAARRSVRRPASLGR